jgi:hypothetical protein
MFPCLTVRYSPAFEVAFPVVMGCNGFKDDNTYLLLRCYMRIRPLLTGTSTPSEQRPSYWDITAYPPRHWHSTTMCQLRHDKAYVQKVSNGLGYESDQSGTSR